MNKNKITQKPNFNHQQQLKSLWMTTINQLAQTPKQQQQQRKKYSFNSNIN